MRLSTKKMRENFNKLIDRENGENSMIEISTIQSFDVIQLRVDKDKAICHVEPQN